MSHVKTLFSPCMTALRLLGSGSRSGFFVFVLGHKTSRQADEKLWNKFFFKSPAISPTAFAKCPKIQAIVPLGFHWFHGNIVGFIWNTGNHTAKSPIHLIQPWFVATVLAWLRERRSSQSFGVACVWAGRIPWVPWRCIFLKVGADVWWCYVYIYTYTHVSVDVIYVYNYMYTETLAYRENLFHKLKKLSKSVLTSSFEACLQPSLSYELHKSGNCSDGEAFDVQLEVMNISELQVFSFILLVWSRMQRLLWFDQRKSFKSLTL